TSISLSQRRFLLSPCFIANYPALSRRYTLSLHDALPISVGFLDATQEERIMQEQLAILRDQLGVKPAGYRSPSWDVNVWTPGIRSEDHTSELQSLAYLVCRLLLEKKKHNINYFQQFLKNC